MPELKSQVAYLQGLSSGMNLNPESMEGKMFQAIIGVLGDFADSFKKLEENQEKMEEYLDNMNKDLSELESEIYNDREDNQYVDVECPKCGENVCFNADILEDEDKVEVVCPNCEQVVFVHDNDLESADEPEAMEGRKTIPAAIEEDL